MDTSGLITLQDAVDDVLNELENYSDANVLRYTRLGERAIKELNLFSLDKVSTKIMPVSKDLNRVNLPSDLLTVLRVGVRLGNGRIYTLTMDEHLMLSSDVASCTNVSLTGTEPAELNAGDSIISNYSIRGGQSEYGSYRVDYSLNVIQLGLNVNLDEIVVEYVSSGIKIDGVTYIQEITREAVIAYIKYKSRHTGNSSGGERQELKMEYELEKKKLENLMIPSFDEMYDALLGLNTPLVIR